jgi:hypothetical protein
MSRGARGNSNRPDALVVIRSAVPMIATDAPATGALSVAFTTTPATRRSVRCWPRAMVACVAARAASAASVLALIAPQPLPGRRR